MSYVNPEIPEGINVSPGNPFRDFIVQGGAALIALVVLVWGIFQAGQLLGPLIPFSWEKQFSELALREFPLTDSGAEAEARREVLQRLTDQLVPAMDLPEGMTITIHYSNEPVVNAFATLGGNIVIFEGLIERLPSENALSMVIAHEIGHVKNRDVVRGLSGSSLVTFIVGLATGDSGLAAELVANIQLLTELQYSRHAEERSDREGVTALFGHYTHINGYQQTFDALEDWLHDIGGQDRQPPEFLRSHPDTRVRVAKIEAFAGEKGWPTQGELTPLRQANFPPEGPVAGGSGFEYGAGGGSEPAPQVKRKPTEENSAEGDEAGGEEDGNTLPAENAPAPPEGEPAPPEQDDPLPSNPMPVAQENVAQENEDAEPASQPFEGFGN